MAVLSFPPFRLDVANQCLSRELPNGGYEQVPLRPKAFAVLTYLASRAGQLVTDEELLNVLWPGVFVQPEAVKSQIYDIRQVLGDAAKTPRYIQTLPKRGYRFVARVADGAVGQTAVSADRANTPYVGRAASVAELRKLSRAAFGGHRQMVFVTGEPGIGKTTLVDVFQRDIAGEHQDVRVARGQCIEGYGGREAYYPILEMFGQLCRGPRGSAVIDLLAEQAPTWLVQFPALVAPERRAEMQRDVVGATGERMLREAAVALESLTTATPLLLIVEDLQWADQSTLGLLSVIAHRRARANLMIVVTVRSFDTAALKDFQQQLVFRQLGCQIELHPLTQSEVADYLAAGSSTPSLPLGLAEVLHRHSGGNPMFMVAVVEHLGRRGLLARADDRWYLPVPLDEIELGVPENLRQLIEAQVDRLSSEEQRVLEAASVSGVSFDSELVAAAIGETPDATDDVVSSVARRFRVVGLAKQASAGTARGAQRFEFAHALYREVLYGRQSPFRRAKLHRRIGEYLEIQHAPDLGELAPELAHHFRACGDWPRTARYLQLAADRATRRYAHPAAAELLREALDVLRKLPQKQRLADEVAVLERLAMTYSAGYDERATETFMQVAEHAARSGLVHTNIRALLGAAFPLSCISSERCMEVLDRALALTAELSDSSLRAQMRATVYFNRLWTRGWDRADREAFDLAFTEIEKSGDRAAMAYHMLERSELAWFSSRYREACHYTSEGFRILWSELSLGSDINLSLAHWGYRLEVVWTPLFAGEWGDAIRGAREGVAIMERNADHYCAQTLRLFQAWIHLFAFDHAAAAAFCESAFDISDQPQGDSNRRVLKPLPAELRIALIIIGSAQVGLRQFERARVNLERAREDIEQREVIFGWYWKMPLESARTELAIAEERWADGRVSSQRFHAAAQDTEEYSWQALAWRAMAQVALGEHDLEEARRCVTEALGLVSSRELPLAAWRVHALAADVARAGDDERGARHHSDVAVGLVKKLADSLPKDEPLREIFLSASPVAALVDQGSAVNTGHGHSGLRLARQR